MKSSFSFCLIVILFASESIFGQGADDPAVGLRQVTPAGDFETLASLGWNSTDADVEVISRDWVPDPESPLEAALGSRLLKLRPTQGGFAETFAVSDAHVGFVVSAKATVNKLDPNAWAGVGITWFDANWQFVSETKKEIKEINDQHSLRGIGDGLELYSIGATRPYTAAWATIWCWHSAGAEVLVDDFVGYEYIPAAPNLLAMGYELQGFPRYFTGSEFFLPSDSSSVQGINPGIIVIPGLKGLPSRQLSTVEFGNADTPTIAYQSLSVRPNQSYWLIYRWEASGAAVLGVDYQDDSGKVIATNSAEIFGNSNPFTGAPRLPVQLPAGATNATFWIYVPATDRTVKLTTLQLVEV